MAMDGVLFDKDGTLFDFPSMWEPAYRAAAEAIAASTGVPGQAARLLAVGGYDPEFGVLDPASPMACGTTDAIIALWMAEPGVAGVPDCAARVRAIFHAHATHAPRPLVDLAALFARLRRRGLRLGVATTDDTATAQALFERFAVSAHLDFVAGGDSAFGVKPDPGVVAAFCRQAGIDPRQVVVVGDSVRDMSMARRAGAGLAVGVLSGVTPRAVLAPAADCVIDSIADLDDVLGPPGADP